MTGIGKFSGFILLSIVCVLVFARQSPQPTATASAAEFGIAVLSEDKICMSSRHLNLAPHALLTLITPSDEPGAATAEVVRTASKACPGIRDDKSAYHSYELKMRHGSVEEDMPVIASTAAVADFHVGRAVVEQKIASSREVNTFRSCTSTDGVHLTVWRGKPLTGKRIWHQYYYLGQDLEANCTDKDTAQ